MSLIKRLVSIALNACAVTKSIKNAEVTAFLNQVARENVEIQKASPEINGSIIKDLGEGDPERLFHEGFSIRLI